MTTQARIDGATLVNTQIVKKLRAMVTNRTLAGNITLADEDTTFQVLDPGGASRDVTLPSHDATVAGNLTGGIFFIYNNADAAENLVIKNVAAATIVTVNQNEAAIVFNDGTAWFGRVMGI